MQDVDAKMWDLFKNGVGPKEFFQKPEVRMSLKSLVEQHEEEKLLEQAKRLADKYINKIQKQKNEKKELEQKAIVKSMSERNLDVEKLKKKLKLDLVFDKSPKRVKDSWKKYPENNADTVPPNQFTAVCRVVALNPQDCPL